MTTPAEVEVNDDTKNILDALAHGDPDLLAAGLEVRADAARDRIAPARTRPHRPSRLDAGGCRAAEHHSAERAQDVPQVLERRHGFLLSGCSDQWRWKKKFDRETRS